MRRQLLYLSPVVSSASACTFKLCHSSLSRDGNRTREYASAMKGLHSYRYLLLAHELQQAKLLQTNSLQSIPGQHDWDGIRQRAERAPSEAAPWHGTALQSSRCQNICIPTQRSLPCSKFPEAASPVDRTCTVKGTQRNNLEHSCVCYRRADICARRSYCVCGIHRGEKWQICLG